MGAAVNESELLERLTALRATVRRRLLLYGLCMTGGGSLLALTLIVLVDWGLWLPAPIRLVVAAVFVVGGTAAAAHWLVRPWRARITASQLAGQFERRFPKLGDRLTSTVGFVEACSDGGAPRAHLGSESLVRRVIEETDRTVRRVPLEDALTLRPLARSVAFGLTTLVLVGLIVRVSPDWYATGLLRYALPLRATEWPHRVEIEPLQSDSKVALGGSLLVRMRVTRGADDGLRGIVRVREANGRLSTFAMQREGAADFYATIDAVHADLTYWFEAGDASTAAAPARVTVVTPPDVAEATVRIVAPDYAQPRPAEELALTGGEIRAVVGSVLTVTVRTGRPVGVDEQGGPTARLEFDGAEPVPLEFVAEDAARLTGRFELRQNDTLRIVLRDADGFENTARRDYRLVALPDEPPVVTVTEPSAITEVSPGGSVTLVAHAEDDLGIRDVRLTAEVVKRAEPFTQVLVEHPAAVAAGARLAADIRYAWALTPLKLQIGDVVDYRVVVTDNFAGQDAPGHSAASPPLRLKVVNPAELENRLRDEFMQLEARVRQAMLDQQTLRDEAGGLAEGGDAPAGPEAARRLARRQSQLADQVHRLAERFDRAAERVRLNQAFDEPTRRQTADVTRQLERTASGNMTQAARVLERLGAPRAADQSPTSSATASQPSDSGSPSAEAATTAQTAAIDELQQVLRWMSRWGDFQESVAKARDLLDRQQQIREATLRQGRQAVGKPVAALSDEERTQLKRVLREQEQLARELEQWLGQGRGLIERLQGKDAASAEALGEAVRAAVAHGVGARMEKAAAALTDNRTAAAGLEQRGAESGLAAVLAALEARQVRELTELRKSVERLLDALAEIVRRQEAVTAATEEARARDVGTNGMAGLADEQRLIRRNTRQLGEELSEAPPTAKAAGVLKQAVPPMERAEDALRVTAAERAVPDQRDALAALQAALAELQLLAAQTEHQLMQKTLAQVRRVLEQLRDRQQEVNDASQEVVDEAKAAAGRPNRAVTRRATRLAEQQDGIRQDTVTVRGELEQTAVYAWVMDRLAGKMTDVRTALTERRLDDGLLETEHGIVSELAQLIDALAAIETLPPPDQFADGAGGEGGGTAAPNQPPVPPVAELMVIKAMQQDLNAQTVKLHATHGGAEPTEADLRRARAIGRDQEQLRLLTERVTQKARNGE
jgi:hypothetical protein